MSTRSAIIYRDTSGEYRGIYCHFDGYLDGVGAVLARHYLDIEKVAALIALGDISSLGERVAPIGKHSFDSREDGTTCAYMRDRGEAGRECKAGATVAAVAETIGHDGYVYVFESGKWKCNGRALRVKRAA